MQPDFFLSARKTGETSKEKESITKYIGAKTQCHSWIRQIVLFRDGVSEKQSRFMLTPSPYIIYIKLVFSGRRARARNGLIIYAYTSERTANF